MSSGSNRAGDTLTATIGAHVMLVEDDARIRHVLGLALADEGYRVTVADSGEQGLQRLEAQPPDVVLLDLMLPGINGLEVCREIRRRGDLPVIVVTARGDSADVVAGLEAGADDYMTKPLVAKELDARIRALLRRARQSSGGDDAVRVGDLEVLPRQGVVRRAGAPIPLTKTEFRLLCELTAEPGRLVTREQLLERVWGYGYFGDTRLIDVHIRRLRLKIEPDPADPRLVLTVRGLGYRVAV